MDVMDEHNCFDISMHQLERLIFDWMVSAHTWRNLYNVAVVQPIAADVQGGIPREVQFPGRYIEDTIVDPPEKYFPEPLPAAYSTPKIQHVSDAVAQHYAGVEERLQQQHRVNEDVNQELDHIVGVVNDHSDAIEDLQEEIESKCGDAKPGTCCPPPFGKQHKVVRKRPVDRTHLNQQHTTLQDVIDGADPAVVAQLDEATKNRRKIEAEQSFCRLHYERENTGMNVKSDDDICLIKPQAVHNLCASGVLEQADQMALPDQNQWTKFGPLNFLASLIDNHAATSPLLLALFNDPTLVQFLPLISEYRSVSDPDYTPPVNPVSSYLCEDDFFGLSDMQ